MKPDLQQTENKPAAEPVIIADECGDTMWDAVLQQEVKVCDVKTIPKNTASLLKSIDAAQVSDTTKA
ncbi:hypothetical protein FRZ67_03065 [Panacibacter ginsenosidivorans]|uniref:Uncharacterized protein n=1 Tax=Panacibacter ginsenosidivorans TaxID=1813871 RepID=A0A5B8V5J1_9BACT|nr:hypothetical protein [Panacibacter ginsenosidivorans]QEC66335.1 hypothetical protein FRZ67_03065 [Panacibacter ginsenosidivorans]